MHEVITNAEQVTPEWLTRILYEKGYPSRSNVISVQEINRSQHTSTWFADISFLEVSYFGTDIGKLSNGETSNAEILGFPHSLRETEEMFPGFVDFTDYRLSESCSIRFGCMRGIVPQLFGGRYWKGAY